MVGAFVSVLGFWGELVWPLPGPYNMLFYDPTLLGGMLLLAFAILVHLKLPTQYLGVLAGVSGLGIEYYGARGYLLSLTKDPLEMFLLFLGFDLTAALAHPVTLYVDWYILEPSRNRPTASPSAAMAPVPRFWNVPVLAFLVLAALPGIAAILMGLSAVWSHLEYAP